MIRKPIIAGSNLVPTRPPGRGKVTNTKKTWRKRVKEVAMRTAVLERWSESTVCVTATAVLLWGL